MRTIMTRLHRFAVILTIIVATPWPAAAIDGDAARGRRFFGACAACHSLEADRNMTGPSLAGVWGRHAGGLSSFERYSPALKSSAVVWNDQTLDEWLKDPAHFI